MNKNLNMRQILIGKNGKIRKFKVNKLKIDG